MEIPYRAAVIMTHPTKEDIQRAIDDGYYIDQVFSGGGDEEKLVNGWMVQAGGNIKNISSLRPSTAGQPSSKPSNFRLVD